VFQFSIEGDSEFSRRPIHNRNISDNKTKKQKAARRARLLLVTFLGEARKVTSRRATPGKVDLSYVCSDLGGIHTHPHPNPPLEREGISWMLSGR
jgi:hypothetical protein